MRTRKIFPLFFALCFLFLFSVPALAAETPGAVKGQQTIVCKNVTKKKGAKNFNLDVKVTTSDGTPHGALSYKSDNKKVAKVTAAGRVDVNHIGTAHITVKAAATNTTAAAETVVTIKVIPKTVRLNYVRAIMGKSLTASWKKGSGVSGYEVRWSRKKDMKKASVVDVPGASVRSKTIRSLKVGKKYYVQVRAYKTVKKVKYYSKWSRKLSGVPRSPRTGY